MHAPNPPRRAKLHAWVYMVVRVQWGGPPLPSRMCVCVYSVLAPFTMETKANMETGDPRPKQLLL